MRRLCSVIIEDEHLTPAQAAHIETLSKDFVSAMSEKYIRGQREHGGNLYDKSIDFLLDAAIEEAIDQVTYLLSLRRALRLRVETSILQKDHNQ